MVLELLLNCFALEIGDALSYSFIVCSEVAAESNS